MAGLPSDGESLRSLFALALAVALGAHAALFVRARGDLFTNTVPACALALAGLLLATGGYALCAAAVAWGAIVVEQLPHPIFARARPWAALAGSFTVVALWSYPAVREASRVQLIPVGTVVPFESGARPGPEPGPSLRDQFPHVLRRIMQGAPYNPPSNRAPSLRR